MVSVASCTTWFMARPVRGIRPRGRPTSLGAQRSRQKSRNDSAAPSLREGVPCASRSLRPRRTRAATLCSNSRHESVLEASCARASMSCDARRLQRGKAKQPTASNPMQQPAEAGCSVFGIGYSGAPLLNRREAQKPRARAQLASRTDSRRLFERSERSERSEFGAALGFEHRRGARRAGFAGAPSLPTFLCAQEGRSPARANSGHGPGQTTTASTEPPTCL
jgi:hypothetical protein